MRSDQLDISFMQIRFFFKCSFNNLLRSSQEVQENMFNKNKADNSQDSETKTFRTDHSGRLWCMFSQLNKYQRCNKQINK